MRKDFLIERQGKQVVLYQGLLDLAHERGLKSIVTHLVQVPTAENSNVAICQATVVLVTNGVERVFTGFGDASPKNVAPAMQNCLLRMSETRAKARALRDAVNVGMVAFEELEGDDAPAVLRPASSPTPRRTAMVDPNAPASMEQCNAIRRMCEKQGIEPPDFDTITQAQASGHIKRLQEIGRGQAHG